MKLKTAVKILLLLVFAVPAQAEVSSVKVIDPIKVSAPPVEAQLEVPYAAWNDADADFQLARSYALAAGIDYYSRGGDAIAGEIFQKDPAPDPKSDIVGYILSLSAIQLLGFMFIVIMGGTVVWLCRTNIRHLIFYTDAEWQEVAQEKERADVIEATAYRAAKMQEAAIKHGEERSQMLSAATSCAGCGAFQSNDGVCLYCGRPSHALAR